MRWRRTAILCRCRVIFSEIRFSLFVSVQSGYTVVLSWYYIATSYHCSSGVSVFRFRSEEQLYPLPPHSHKHPSTLYKLWQRRAAIHLIEDGRDCDTWDSGARQRMRLIRLRRNKRYRKWTKAYEQKTGLNNIVYQDKCRQWMAT